MRRLAIFIFLFGCATRPGPSSSPARLPADTITNYPFLPQVPKIGRPTDQEISNSFLFFLANENYPDIQQDEYFQDMISNVLGVCTTQDPTKQLNFDCARWAAGRTYLVIKFEKDQQRAYMMLESLPTQDIVDDYSQSTERGRNGVPYAYTNHGPPANPLFFYMNAELDKDRHIYFHGQPFADVPLARNATVDIHVDSPTDDPTKTDLSQLMTFAPSLRNVNVKFSFRYHKWKYFEKAVSKTKTVLQRRWSPVSFEVEGKAWRCAQEQCGVNASGY